MRLTACVTTLVVVLSRGSFAQADTVRPPRLEPVKVTERAPGHLAIGRDAFDERRALGFGHFYDSTELRRTAANRVADLLQSESGVTVVRPPMCTPPGRADNPDVHHNNCVTAVSTRVAVTRALCAMRIVLDGQVLTPGGDIDTRDQRYDPRHNWTTAFDVSSLDLQSLDKLEIYRHSDEVPMEYRNGETQCGLLLLWTRH